MLRHRLITAAILIPFFIWVTLALPSRYFAVITAVIVALGAWEWTGLAGLNRKWRYTGVFVTIVMMGVMAVYVIETKALYALLGIVVIWWVAGLSWVVSYNRKPATSPCAAGAATLAGGENRLGRAAVGLLVLVPAWTALVALHESGVYGPNFVLFLFVLIGMADSGAYFAGRWWGKAKLMPNVSPGKTWSGVAGGLWTALLVSVTGGVVLGLSWEETRQFTIVGLVTTAFSIVGDLLESMYKRQAGVKDSGALLPGHGGVLDRIDSITAAAPLFLAGLLLAGIPN